MTIKIGKIDDKGDSLVVSIDFHGFPCTVVLQCPEGRIWSMVDYARVYNVRDEDIGRMSLFPDNVVQEIITEACNYGEEYLFQQYQDCGEWSGVALSDD